MHNDPPSREKSRKAAQLMGVGCLKHPQVAPALSWCFTVVGAARGFGFRYCKVRVFCKKKKKKENAALSQFYHFKVLKLVSKMGLVRLPVDIDRQDRFINLQDDLSCVV